VRDRYVLTLKAALASNTGGPYTATWDNVVVPADGTITRVWAGATSVTSNAFTSKIDIYYQGDAPSAGSNTATTVLVDPLTIQNDQDYVQGTVRHSGARVTAGGRLQLRTYSGNAGSKPAFIGPTASIEIDRDPD
jgi:hypothetical protein